MDRQPPVTVPESLRYRDGLYKFERFPRAGAVTSIRDARRVTRPLRAIHQLWFAVWMPMNVAALTTTGRKSRKPRTTFVRAYRDGDKAYLVSIGGEHALWLNNIRANPEVTLRFRRDTLSGTARDPHNDAERQAVRDAFCGSTHPFDYAENMFHRKGLPTRAKVIELHTAWLEGGSPVIVDVES
ncbi:nitroreductase family deazaflavin-dependent oxidoreductase [Mycobacterium sp. 852002-51971_SCH5477799-a]|uniref:nitroreductase family deazaflavin-dependent oxidoreductase n=1 Tax=Mycobacterium sp. 852002-51971_SCH5477799-a TaxID=1834106 RepID=UPI000A433F5E|nr:nitroreductase family deazaflavin-dependent oxidoreductase [Mycobacterium sp. 852002-51971_SCH5477799-a]